MSDIAEPGQPQKADLAIRLWPVTSAKPNPPTVIGVTDDAIGIDVCGTVIVKPIREWHSYPAEIERLRYYEKIVLDGAHNLADLEEITRLRRDMAKALQHLDKGSPSTAAFVLRTALEVPK